MADTITGKTHAYANRPTCKCGAFYVNPKHGIGHKPDKSKPALLHTAEKCDADPIALEHKAIRDAQLRDHGMLPPLPPDPNATTPARVFRITTQPSPVTVAK